ncbi:MAG: hypothetical protein ACK48K_04645, partial [Planctomycetota bacterium]
LGFEQGRANGNPPAIANPQIHTDNQRLLGNSLRQCLPDISGASFVRAQYPGCRGLYGDSIC